MPTIELTTFIRSDIYVCFDLSRSIDLHVLSTTQTKEKAIAGRTNGLINLNEFVTWEAIHFGIKQQLTSKITEYNRPFYFRDEQQKGAFNSFLHNHYFEKKNDLVVMMDALHYTSPFGLAGKIFNALILTGYLKKLLVKRNQLIKEFAESGEWKKILS
ncbi:MAG TPA: SRPBCC family protein [Parafilimonas sp.]|nr:SRPBCC family protein [Parafilimonas sp.]